MGQNEYRAYDALGRLTGVPDARGAVWANVYDMEGNRLSASDPDLGTWTYQYDAANRLVSQTDARGVRTALTHDKLGRLLTRKIASPVVPDPVLTSNVYDEARAGYFNVGRLTTSGNSARAEAYNYSGGGVLQNQASSDAAGSHSVTAGLYTRFPIHKTYAPGPLAVGNSGVKWLYDGAGRLKSIPGMIASQTYEADGQTKKITYANNVSTEFFYSATRRWLLRITTKNAVGDALIDNVYTRDLSGRITRINGLSNVDDNDYAYDDLDRLVSVNNLGDATLDETFTYDPAGNMLSRKSMAYVYPAGTVARPPAHAALGQRPGFHL